MYFRIINSGLIVLVAGLFSVSCSGKTESTPSANLAAAVDSVASADGTMIHYKVSGQGEPALVFVHCWECNMSYWDNQVDVFNKKHKVITLDLAGHGESGAGREDYTLEAFGQDVAAVVSRLDLGKIILIGHSMGGPVNIEAGRLLGDRVLAIVGVDTYNDIDYEYPENQIQQWVQAMESDFYGTTMEFVKNLFPSEADSAIVDKISKDMASASPEVGTSSMRNVARYDYVERIQGVSAPFYLICADTHPVDTIAGNKYTSGYHVKIMHGVGHFLHMERPEEFNRLLEHTIQEIITASRD